MLVPSKTAKGPPKLGSVAERIWPPGAPTSGFSMWPRRSARRRKARDDAAPAGGESAGPADRAGARPPRPARNARSCWPSRSAIIPPRTSSCTGIEFASPGRLSTTTIPTPPAPFTRALLSAKVHVPRETSAIAPFSEPARSAWGRRRGSRAGRRDRAAPAGRSCRRSCRRRRAADPTLAQAAGVAGPAVRTNGIRVSASGVPGAVTDSAGAKTCEFERGDRDRVGALPASRPSRRRSRRGRCRPRSRERRRRPRRCAPPRRARR